MITIIEPSDKNPTFSGLLRHCTEENKLNSIFTEWYRRMNAKTESKIVEYSEAKTNNEKIFAETFPMQPRGLCKSG